MSSAGSSPLTRGKPEAVEVRTLRRGLIPAHAGKTRSCKSCLIVSTAHPRSRGENDTGGRRQVGAGGSSPLTRGKLVVVATLTLGAGLIPAHAGKTKPVRLSFPTRRAHPRSRGENPIPSTARLTYGGSSPLTRGKHRQRGWLLDRNRLIPAHAGKTARCPLRV